jgi:dTDP-4-amino-4,6-dideoxygalactose transaminase
MIIPYGKQFIDNKDISGVALALKNEKITTGKTVINFENSIKNYIKCKYAVVCNSGTSALFLALKAIGTKKNDIIVMPAINFIASYNIARLLGAKIYLSDTDEKTGQMSPTDVENCCKKFKLKKIKAIIPMYNGGFPHNAENFFQFKKKYGAYIIEDACHAFGASYKFKKSFFKVGSCKHVDISTFSFHPLKTITTGEGGLVTTNNQKLFKIIQKIRSHGILRTPNKHWEYDVVIEGLNFRLTDFQAALGTTQLKKINKFINFREKIFNFYNKEFKDIEQIICPKKLSDHKPSYHLYIINFKNVKPKTKIDFIKFMKKNNVIIQQHYIPIYKFKLFKGNYYGTNTENYYKNSVSLPIYYNLNKKKQLYIVNLIKSFFAVN